MTFPMTKDFLLIGGKFVRARKGHVLVITEEPVGQLPYPLKPEGFGSLGPKKLPTVDK